MKTMKNHQTTIIRIVFHKIGPIFMKINAFRNQKLSIQVIDFLQKNNKLNSSLLSLNLEWNILLSELNSVSPSESSSQNGELVKKEIYNARIDIIKNYLNE